MKTKLKHFATSLRRSRFTALLGAAGFGGSIALSGAASLTWTGANSSTWDTATQNWLLPNSAPSTYANGDFVLFNDSTVNTAISLDQAVRPGGMTVSNNAADYTLSGSGYLTGSGGLVKQGTARLILSNTGTNDFTGGVVVNAGTLQVGSSSSLGATNGPATVAGGAQLSVISSGVALANPITLSGSGPDGSGAFVNVSGSTSPAQNLTRLALAGDTTIGGNAKITLGGGATADAAQSSLSTGGRPYKLTYVGSGAFCLGSAMIDPALGDVEVQSGYFNIQYNLTGLGNPTNTLSVWPGAHLYFVQPANQLEKALVLQGDGSTASLFVGGSSLAKVGGSILLASDCIFNVGGAGELDVNGGVSGANLLQNGLGKLAMNGTMTHTSTTASAGTLTLNGTHTGAITVMAGAALAGTGTNYGSSDLYGALLPGGSNQVGTLTLKDLVLEWGANVSVELGATNAVGGGINDLIQVNGDLTVNGNAVAVNTQGILLTGPAHPYRLINYTGNLVWNSDLVVTGPNGYVFTVDRSTPGQINLVVSGGPLVWNGGSLTDNNWADAANWSGTAIAPANNLVFVGGNRLNNTNDTAAGTSYGDLSFLPGAAAFLLNGNPVALGGNITNSSASRQSVLLGLNFGTSQTIDGGNAGLTLGGGLTNTFGAPGTTKLTLAGQGTLTNLLSSLNSPGGTNNLYFPSGANWTLEDNPAHALMAVPWSFAADGTFNFGSTNTSPLVTITTPNLTGISGLSYNSIGTVAGAVGTLNVRGGNLMLANNRIYTAVAANTTGIINVSGGALNVRGSLQGAAGAGTNEVSIINVSGGLLNMGSTNNSTAQNLYVAMGGRGSLNVSGSGTVMCVTLDVSANQRGNTMGSVGSVNLDGGILLANTVTNASSGAQAGLTNGTAATFNFNGGTLKARGTGTTVFQGSTGTPVLPIQAIVKAGGAVLDTAYSLAMNEALQHDPALGGALDGGLTKLGGNWLALSQPCTYNGPTYISKGTLILTNNGSIANSTTLSVTNGAVLDVSALTTTFSLASGQSLTGRGGVKGDVVVGSGATLAPGYGTGTLTFSNSLILNGGSTTVLGLNRALNPSNAMAQVVGPLTYGGKLVVTNLGTTALQAGDSFRLFAAGSYAGAFTNIVYPSGYTWTNTLAQDGSVSVLSVLPALPTTPTNVTYTVSGKQLTLSWPAAYQGWFLQWQTNALTRGLGTNWVDVPNSAAVTTTNFTVDPANPTLFFRLRYP